MKFHNKKRILISSRFISVSFENIIALTDKTCVLLTQDMVAMNNIGANFKH